MLDPLAQAKALIRDDDSSLPILWGWYWGNGGNAGLMEFHACLYDLMVLDPFDLKILVWALEDFALHSS